MKNKTELMLHKIVSLLTVVALFCGTLSFVKSIDKLSRFASEVSAKTGVEFHAKTNTLFGIEFVRPARRKAEY